MERRPAPVERGRPKAGGAVSRPAGGNHALLHQQAGQDGRLHRSHGVLLQGLGCAPDDPCVHPLPTLILPIDVFLVLRVHLLIITIIMFTFLSWLQPCAIFVSRPSPRPRSTACGPTQRRSPPGRRTSSSGRTSRSFYRVRTNIHMSPNHSCYTISLVSSARHTSYVLPITHADSCDDGNSSGSLYASLEQSNSKKYAAYLRPLWLPSSPFHSPSE